MIERVQRVVCPDTGRDITDLVNDAALRQGFDPVDFLGGLIAESGLDEHSARERTWPDVSYGLAQPTVKWHGKAVPGVQRAADGTVADTESNRYLVRHYFFDAERTIDYVAPLYVALLRRWGNPLEAWCRWNKPSIPGSQNPNRANYVRGLAEAEKYRATEEKTTMPPAAQQFVVGPGIKDAMARNGDVPMGDEFYPAAAYSMCPGKKFLYVYSFQANQTYTCPLA